MAIKRYAGDKITGLSSDTKPTNIPDGATFYELDTGRFFMRHSGSWDQAGYISESDFLAHTDASNPHSGSAPVNHNHAAGDITSGTLHVDRIPNLPASQITSGSFAVARGGTGRTSLTSGFYLRGAGTSSVALVTPADVLTDIGAASASHDHDSDYATTGHGHSDLTPTSRTLTAGTGITGGGNLTANRTFNFDTTWGDNRYSLDGHTHEGGGAHDHDSDYAAISHNHAAGDITSGTIATARLPNASTSAQGIVQLNNTVTSTSTTLAATANAVKTANDNANHSHPYAATSHNHSAGDITSGTIAAARLPDASTSAQGIVQLNNTVTSTSTTLAATANAARLANNNANNRVLKSGDTMTGRLTLNSDLIVDGPNNGDIIWARGTTGGSATNSMRLIPAATIGLTTSNWDLAWEVSTGANPRDLWFAANSGTVRLRPTGGVYSEDEITVDSGPRLSDAGSSDLRVTTDHGWFRMGPRNSSWCHVQTGANNGFYFYERVHVNSYLTVQNYAVVSGEILATSSTYRDHLKLERGSFPVAEFTPSSQVLGGSGGNALRLILSGSHTHSFAENGDYAQSGTELFIGNGGMSLRTGASGGSSFATIDVDGDPWGMVWYKSTERLRSPWTRANNASVGGNVHVNSSGYFYYATSSLRYKTDIRNMQLEEAYRTLQCRPIRFKGTGKVDIPGHTHYGYGAEEVAEIDPRLVTFAMKLDDENEETGEVDYDTVETVQYDRFIPHHGLILAYHEERIRELERALDIVNERAHNRPIRPTHPHDKE